jgi:hypothetical protein
MNLYVQFFKTDKDGSQQPILGSDGYMRIDGRWSTYTCNMRIRDVLAHRRLDSVTHYGYSQDLRNYPRTLLEISR